MCPFCSGPATLGSQKCQICTLPFVICSDCLWAVNDVCGNCGKTKCLPCRQIQEACSRTVKVAREGTVGQQALNTFQTPLLEVGLMTWNINHFENLPQEKSRAIEVLFEKHPWLDVLALQEINASASLEVTANGLVMEKGPKITGVTTGKEPKSSRAKTFWDKGLKRWVRPHQQEYYPVIFRTSTTSYVKSSVLPLCDLTKEEEMLRWTKSKTLRAKYAPFRPIIVHTVIVQSQPVNIAVVHTTPEGSGLGRKGEYLQVIPIMEYAARAGGYWIIAGDYYLDPESTTQSNTDVLNRDPEQLFRAKVEELGLTFAISISATNQSFLQRGIPAIYDRVTRIIDGEEQVVLNKRADFFLYNNNAFARVQAGVVSPRGGLIEVDPDHHALNWWRQTSDHAPVGAIFCSSMKSIKLDEMTEEKWLEPGVMEKAQAQLAKIYKDNAYNAAIATKEMIELIAQFPNHKMTGSAVAKRFCCLVGQVSYTWSDWLQPYVSTLAGWLEETKHVTYREAMHFADNVMHYTFSELEDMSVTHTVRSNMIMAVQQGRRALFGLDLDCTDIDITDEDDKYEDVFLLS